MFQKQKNESTLLDLLEKLNDNIRIPTTLKLKDIAISNLTTSIKNQYVVEAESESSNPNDYILDFKERSQSPILTKIIQVKNKVLFGKFLELRKMNLLFEQNLKSIKQKINNKMIELGDSQEDLTSSLQKILRQISVIQKKKNLDFELEEETVQIRKLFNNLGISYNEFTNMKVIIDKLYENNIAESEIFLIEIALLSKYNFELKIELRNTQNNIDVVEKKLKEKMGTLGSLLNSSDENSNLERNEGLEKLLLEYENLEGEFKQVFEKKINLENQIYDNNNELKKTMNHEFKRFKIEIRIEKENRNMLKDIKNIQKFIEDLENLQKTTDEIIKDIEHERKKIMISPIFLTKICLSPENQLVQDYQTQIESIFKFAEQKIIDNHNLLFQRVAENQFMTISYDGSLLKQDLESSETKLGENLIVDAEKLLEKAKNKINISDLKYLDLFLKNLKKSPNLCQQIVMIFILYLSLRIQGFESNQLIWKDLIKDLKGKMKKRNSGSLVQTKVENLIKEFENHRYQEALILLKQLLIEEFTYIDLIRLELLSEEVKQKEQYFKGNDLILFLGSTGVGKSTSLLYLSGKTMVNKTFYNNKNEPISAIVSEEVVEGITPSFQMKSETKNLTILHSVFDETDLFMCDTPGFSDTLGEEEAFFNFFNIVKSAQKANTVKMVVFISKSGFDERKEIRSLLRNLVIIMPDILDYLSNFLFLFTKFENNKESKDEIRWKLNDLHEKIKKDEPGNTSELGILSHIIDQCKKFLKIISPLSRNPKTILEKINKMKPIKKPLEFFKLNLSENMKTKLNEKFWFFEKEIINNSIEDFNEIIYNLDQIKFLQENLEIDFLDEKYQSMVSRIKQKLSEESDKIIFLLQENEIDNHLIEELQKTIEKLKFLKKTDHFANLDVNSTLISNLTEKLLKLKEQLERKDNPYNNPENLKILTQIFLVNKKIGNYLAKEDLTKLSESSDIISSKFDEKFDLIVKFIEKSQFEEFLNEFEPFEAAKLNFKEFLENVDNFDFFEDFKKKIGLLDKRFLRLISNEIIFEIDDNEIEELKKNFSALENLVDNPKFNQIYGPMKELANNLYTKVLSQIFVYFDNSSKTLKEENVSLKYYQKILTQMKIMKRDSKNISDKIELSFNESIRAFRNFLRNIYETTKFSFETLRDNNNKKREKDLYENIRLKLSEIKDAEWILNFTDDELQNCYSRSVKLIEEFCNELIEELSNLAFDITKLEVDINVAERICKSFIYSYAELKIFLNPEVDMKFKNIQNASQQKIEKMIKIEDILKQEFENFEYKEAVSQLNLVDILKKLRYFKFDDIYKKLFSDLKEKIYKYQIYVFEGLKNTFEEIKSFKDMKNESEFEKLVEKLCSFMNKSNIIKEESEITKNQKELSEVQGIFGDLFALFANLKERKTEKKRFFDLRKIYYLTKIDAYNKNKSTTFAELYEKVHNSYYADIPQVSEIISDLKNWKYKIVKEKLDELGQKVDATSVDNLNKVKQELISYFRLLIEKTKKLAETEINLSNEAVFEYNMNSMMDCHKNLKDGLMEALEILESYLKIEGFDLHKEVNEIMEILESSICSKITFTAQKFLEIENIKIFDKCVRKIKSLIKIFNDFELSKIRKTLNEAKTQKESVLDKIVEKVKNFNLNNHADIGKFSFYLKNFLLTSHYEKQYTEIFIKIEEDLGVPLEDEKITPEKEHFLKKSLENLTLLYQIIEKNHFCYLKEIIKSYKEILSKYQEDDKKIDLYLENKDFKNINNLVRKSNNSELNKKIENYFEKAYSLNEKLLEFYDGMQKREPKIWKKVSNLTEGLKILCEIECLNEKSENSKNELNERIEIQLLDFFTRLKNIFSISQCDDSLTFKKDAKSLFIYVFEAIKVLTEATNRTFFKSEILIKNYHDLLQTFNDSFDKMIRDFNENLNNKGTKLDQFKEIAKVSRFYDQTLLFISTINKTNIYCEEILTGIQQKYAEYSYLKIIEKIRNFYETMIKVTELKDGVNSFEKFKREMNITDPPKQAEIRLYLSNRR